MSSKTLDDHIELTPDTAGGKPRIRGRRVTVQDIAIWHERLGKSADEISAEYDLTLADVYAAAWEKEEIKKLNAKGPPILGRIPSISPFPPREFQSAIKRRGSQVVDTRQMLAFGGGHIPGALNIGPRPELSVWAGQMLDYDHPIFLIVDDETKIDWFVWQFVHTGFTNFGGYLAGGMKAWANAGLPLVRTPQMSVQELKNELENVQLLDVRSPQEWEKGHIPDAQHFYVADMRNARNGRLRLSKRKPVAIYCDSGYRADIAASLLESRGFTAADFQVFHPGGSLGAALMRVRDIMHSGERLPLAPIGTLMGEAIVMMSRKGFGCLGIVDRAGRLKGIITDGDLRRHLSADLLSCRVEEVMTPRPRTVPPETLVASALESANSAGITALFVIERDRPVGIVHMHDLLRVGGA